MAAECSVVAARSEVGVGLGAAGAGVGVGWVDLAVRGVAEEKGTTGACRSRRARL